MVVRRSHQSVYPALPASPEKKKKKKSSTVDILTVFNQKSLETISCWRIPASGMTVAAHNRSDRKHIARGPGGGGCSDTKSSATADTRKKKKLSNESHRRTRAAPLESLLLRQDSKRISHGQVPPQASRSPSKKRRGKKNLAHLRRLIKTAQGLPPLVPENVTPTATRFFFFFCSSTLVRLFDSFFFLLDPYLQGVVSRIRGRVG
ncbi:hypothetical protein V8C35DRAFT_155833 [Trichoderma chlorosporum]